MFQQNSAPQPSLPSEFSYRHNAIAKVQKLFRNLNRFPQIYTLFNIKSLSVHERDNGNELSPYIGNSEEITARW